LPIKDASDKKILTEDPPRDLRHRDDIGGLLFYPPTPAGTLAGIRTTLAKTLEGSSAYPVNPLAHTRPVKHSGARICDLRESPFGPVYSTIAAKIVSGRTAHSNPLPLEETT